MTHKILKSENIFDEKFFHLKDEEIELKNKEKINRVVLEVNNAIVILAITPENKVLFVKQYRAGARKELIELPAGFIDSGELAEKAALRELEEETGYKGEKIIKLCEFFTAPGFSTEKLILYKIENLIKTKQNLDNDEYIEVLEIDLSDISKYKIEDAKTLIGLNFLEK